MVTVLTVGGFSNLLRSTLFTESQLVSAASSTCLLLDVTRMAAPFVAPPRVRFSQDVRFSASVGSVPAAEDVLSRVALRRGTRVSFDAPEGADSQDLGGHDDVTHLARKALRSHSPAGSSVGSRSKRPRSPGVHSVCSADSMSRWGDDEFDEERGLIWSRAGSREERSVSVHSGGTPHGDATCGSSVGGSSGFGVGLSSPAHGTFSARRSGSVASGIADSFEVPSPHMSRASASMRAAAAARRGGLAAEEMNSLAAEDAGWLTDALALSSAPRQMTSPHRRIHESIAAPASRLSRQSNTRHQRVGSAPRPTLPTAGREVARTAPAASSRDSSLADMSAAMQGDYFTLATAAKAEHTPPLSQNQVIIGQQEAADDATLSSHLHDNCPDGKPVNIDVSDTLYGGGVDEFARSESLGFRSDLEMLAVASGESDAGGLWSGRASHVSPLDDNEASAESMSDSGEQHKVAASRAHSAQHDILRGSLTTILPTLHPESHSTDCRARNEIYNGATEKPLPVHWLRSGDYNLRERDDSPAMHGRQVGLCALQPSPNTQERQRARRQQHAKRTRDDCDARAGSAKHKIEADANPVMKVDDAEIDTTQAMREAKATSAAPCDRASAAAAPAPRARERYLRRPTSVEATSKPHNNASSARIAMLPSVDRHGARMPPLHFAVDLRVILRDIANLRACVATLQQRRTQLVAALSWVNAAREAAATNPENFARAVARTKAISATAVSVQNDMAGRRLSRASRPFNNETSTSVDNAQASLLDRLAHVVKDVFGSTRSDLIDAVKEPETVGMMALPFLAVPHPLPFIPEHSITDVGAYLSALEVIGSAAAVSFDIVGQGSSVKGSVDSHPVKGASR